MAPLVLALGEAEGIDTRVCVTGQHRQMLDDVMSAFSLKADYDLNIMRPNQSLSEVFSAVMTGIATPMMPRKPPVPNSRFR